MALHLGCVPSHPRTIPIQNRWSSDRPLLAVVPVTATAPVQNGVIVAFRMAIATSFVQVWRRPLESEGLYEVPCLGAADGRLEVFGEPATTSQPGESSLDDPSSRQHLKPLAVSERLMISMVHVPRLAGACVQFFSGIAAVGEQLSQLGVKPSNGGDDHTASAACRRSVWHRTQALSSMALSVFMCLS